MCWVAKTCISIRKQTARNCYSSFMHVSLLPRVNTPAVREEGNAQTTCFPETWDTQITWQDTFLWRHEHENGIDRAGDTVWRVQQGNSRHVLPNLWTGILPRVLRELWMQGKHSLCDIVCLITVLRDILYIYVCLRWTLLLYIYIYRFASRIWIT